jgi:hypothetical protein
LSLNPKKLFDKLRLPVYDEKHRQVKEWADLGSTNVAVN